MRNVRVHVGTFTPSVLLALARRRGRLAEAHLDVIESPVSSSPAQFASLESGELDVAITSPDNVIAYHYLSANPLGRRLQLRVLAGLDRGTGLSLWLGPGLAGPAAVRGRVVGVDVATSGFAFVAYALLDALGVTREEYQVLNLGSTPRRAGALLEGTCAATVLNAGNELRVAARATRAGDVTSLGPYLGTVLAVTHALERTRREAAEQLSAVLVELAARVLDGSLTDEARAVARDVLDLSEADAAAHVQVLSDPARGLIGDGRVDEPSVATLLSLRRTYLPDRDLDSVEPDLASLLRGAARGA